MQKKNVEKEELSNTLIPLSLQNLTLTIQELSKLKDFIKIKTFLDGKITSFYCFFATPQNDK